MKKTVEHTTFLYLNGEHYKLFLNIDLDNFEVKIGRIDEARTDNPPKIQINNKSQLYELGALITEAIDYFNDLE